MAEKRGTRADVAAKWRERLARWQLLQCSITEFCRREGISQPSFFQWRKRLAASAGEFRRGASLVAPRGAAFVPVQVIATRDSHASRHSEPSRKDLAWLEISYGQLVCRVPTHVDEATLRRLVRVLSEEATGC
jgi:hypothetical protein